MALGLADLEAYGQMVLANPDFVVRLKSCAPRTERRLLSGMTALDQHQPLPHSGGDGIGAVGGAKLHQERRNMELDGVDRDAEPAGDRFVGRAFGKQRQHLRFARRKVDGQAGRSLFGNRWQLRWADEPKR